MSWFRTGMSLWLQPQSLHTSLQYSWGFNCVNNLFTILFQINVSLSTVIQIFLSWGHCENWNILSSVKTCHSLLEEIRINCTLPPISTCYLLAAILFNGQPVNIKETLVWRAFQGSYWLVLRLQAFTGLLCFAHKKRLTTHLVLCSHCKCPGSAFLRWLPFIFLIIAPNPI